MEATKAEATFSADYSDEDLKELFRLGCSGVLPDATQAGTLETDSPGLKVSAKHRLPTASGAGSHDCLKFADEGRSQGHRRVRRQRPKGG